LALSDLHPDTLAFNYALSPARVYAAAIMPKEETALRMRRQVDW